MPDRTDRVAPAGWITVWDLPVRATHWIVVALVLWNFYEDSGGPAHRVVGYIAAALVVFRLVWGLIGSGPGRFSVWFPSPSSVAAYTMTLVRGTPRRHLSHNPLGAVMSMLVWLLILLLGVTGYMSRMDAFWGDEWLHNLHATLSDVLLVCVIIHVLASIAMSFVHRENLIVAMINGRKRTGDKP